VLKIGRNEFETFCSKLVLITEGSNEEANKTRMRERIKKQK